MTQTAQPGEARKRAPRSDKGRMQWTQRDLRALRWVGEQYAIRLDQLAALLARWQSGPTQTPGRLASETVRKLVQRWKKAGLVERALLARGEPGWVWLTHEGLEQMELDYRLWEPKAQSLPHLYAINRRGCGWSTTSRRRSGAPSGCSTAGVPFCGARLGWSIGLMPRSSWGNSSSLSKRNVP